MSDVSTKPEAIVESIQPRTEKELEPQLQQNDSIAAYLKTEAKGINGQAKLRLLACFDKLCDGESEHPPVTLTTVINTSTFGDREVSILVAKFETLLKICNSDAIDNGKKLPAPNLTFTIIPLD
jgi:hypothetical protein